MSTPIALQAFVDANLPYTANRPADPALIKRYENLLPAALLELWRVHGLGYYGERGLWLLNPDIWQAVLDLWVNPGQDETRRIPVMMTPFGTLLYYRKLTDTDEDISALDVFERDATVLSWDFVECFNEEFTNEGWLDDLIPIDPLYHAAEIAGPLEAGQVYQLDQSLSGILTRYTRADALVMYRELFESMQAEASFDYPSPGTLGQALPEVFSEEIRTLERAIADAPRNAAAGFYLTAYLCSYHVLVLAPEDKCALICWTTHPRDQKTKPPCMYHGTYSEQLSEDGDPLIAVDIDKDDDSHPDIASEQAFYLCGGKHPMLIRVEDLTDVADALDWDDMAEGPAYPLRKMGMDYWIPKDDEDRPAPAREDLPMALRGLLRDEPLKLVITDVEEPDEDAEEVIVRARIEANTGRPPSGNMPMCSPAGSDKELHGNVWDEDEAGVRLCMSLPLDEDTSEKYWPAPGDVLVSRKQRPAG